MVRAVPCPMAGMNPAGTAARIRSPGSNNSARSIRCERSAWRDLFTVSV